MAQINLLKNELSTGSSFHYAPKSVWGLYLVIGILVLEGLGYGAMIFYKKTLDKKMTELENSTQNINAEILKLDPQLKEAISAQTRLNNLRTILANQIFWSPVLDELSKYTFQSVALDTLEGNYIGNKLAISGVTPSYTDLAKLILGLRQSPQIKDVVLQASNASQTEDEGYSFSIEVIFDSKLFEK